MGVKPPFLYFSKINIERMFVNKAFFIEILLGDDFMLWMVIVIHFLSLNYFLTHTIIWQNERYDYKMAFIKNYGIIIEEIPINYQKNINKNQVTK